MAANQYPSLLRSEEMSLVQLYIPQEVAHATVEEVGQLSRIQWLDLNPDTNAFSRTFISELRRLDEMERRLRFLTEEINDAAVPLRPFEDTRFILSQRSGPELVDELDPRLKQHEDRLRQLRENWDGITRRAFELEEARHVLMETAVFFKQAEVNASAIMDDGRNSFDEPTAPLLENALEQGHAGEASLGGMSLEFVSGTIDRARMGTFERVLWRVLRGNLYMNYAEIDTPFNEPTKASSGASSKQVYKNVFIIFAHGSELLDKIRRISESLGGTLYNIDSDPGKRSDKLREVNARIEEVSQIMHETDVTRRAELMKIAESITAWWGCVRKEKLIYHAMNNFQYDQGRSTLIAEGWVPTRDVPRVQLALRSATENNGGSMPAILHELTGTAKKPPTFHRTNKFTEGFQSIIDAYGMASYQEINPGLFTVITFPFLFAVMFGDIGHGALMALAAGTLILFEKKIGKGFGSEILDTFYYGRYIIVLMGLFAIYTGFLYNDIFSLNLRMAASGWDWPKGEGVIAAIFNGKVYPFGIDPSWHGADNALLFTNSLKMKMSIILGVIHMSFAICLQVPNFRHFDKKFSIWAEWLPQILFMECIFGYLVICIIYKWSIDWAASGREAPSLLNMLIYMFLSPGTIDVPLYPGQAFIQIVLLLVALVCVPWMLCTKPYILWKQHKKIVAQGYTHLGGAEGGRAYDDEYDQGEEAPQADGAVSGGNGNANGGHEEMSEEHKEEFELGEVAIHQVIHTIEFCLGCISNTASYLRLWALSLAHAQLSEVLWTMTIANGFKFGGVIGTIALFLAFAFWLVLTIAILCVMEGLSAFLHALRLHWVEFNGKFYEGAGTAFQPLNFESMQDDI